MSKPKLKDQVRFYDAGTREEPTCAAESNLYRAQHGRHSSACGEQSDMNDNDARKRTDNKKLLGFMHSEIKQGADSKTQAYTTFMRSVEGVILLASPSGGSGLAKSKILVQGISSLSGGWSTLLHSELIAALKPSSKELPKITADFDGYCDWYSQQQKRQLKMAAFRETAKWKGIAMVRSFPEALLSHLTIGRLLSLSRPKSLLPRETRSRPSLGSRSIWRDSAIPK